MMKSMNKILAAFAVTLAILASSIPAHAEPSGKVWRIGFLTAVSVKPFKFRLAAFRQGLRKLGYVEGDNIVIRERYAKGRREKLPMLAAELVGLKLDVIVTHGDSIARIADQAAKQAGITIPIVLALSSDPVGGGLVASLARPGGNITGLSNSANDLVAKRLQLIKEVVPSASRIAVFWDSRVPPVVRKMKALQAVAPTLGVELFPIEFTKSNVERAFDAVGRERPDVLMVLGWGLISPYRKQIAEFALKSRLPTMYAGERFVLAGGLMSYGADGVDLYRRAATYVDKILKGAKPADLPVELPTKFNFVLNLKTAKALGITFPPSILLRATKVIE